MILILFVWTSRFLRSREWYKNGPNGPIVVLTRFQKRRNRFHSERELFENVFVRCGGTRDFIYLLRPGRNKTFSQVLLEDFVPSSCGQPPLSACAQADPVHCPRPGKRCRRKQGVIPSRAYGRRRYNTLDLASKIVCHGNSLFPLDSLGFRSQ